MRLSILCVCLVACSKASAPSPTSSPAAPAPAATAPAATLAKTLDPSTDVTALVDKLHDEATHRPAIKLTADTVLDALDASGMKIRKRRQYLGVTMHAAYCAGGTTTEGTAVSVCEYASPAAARAGKQFADDRYHAIDATRVVQGQTLLVIASNAHANPEIAQRAIHTFNAL